MQAGSIENATGIFERPSSSAALNPYSPKLTLLNSCPELSNPKSEILKPRVLNLRTQTLATAAPTLTQEMKCQKTSDMAVLYC